MLGCRTPPNRSADAATSRRRSHDGLPRTLPEHSQNWIGAFAPASRSDLRKCWQFTAQLFTAQLRLLNEHIKACDKRIEQLLNTHPDAPIFLSIPGIGPVVAATLIASMGDDRFHYPDARVLLARPDCRR
jgi:transposase